MQVLHVCISKIPVKLFYKKKKNSRCYIIESREGWSTGIYGMEYQTKTLDKALVCCAL